MSIRRLLLSGLIGVLLAAGCSSEKGNFSIDGRITHAGGQRIYLEELQVSSSKIIDSARIDPQGAFRFTGRAVIPTFYLLKINDSKFITLLVDSAEQVTITGDVANFERHYQVEGSPGSLQVKSLNDHLLRTRKQMDSIRSLSTVYGGNPDFSHMKRVWSRKIDSIRQAQVSFSTGFVMENPFSMASVLALYQTFDDQEYIIKDIQPMRVAASALHTIYPQSSHVQTLYQNTLQLLKEEKNARLRQLIREQGENSPDIVLPDPDGMEISLRTLRGKVVLLQFWSANDRDSRILNQALVEAYRKYHARGFEIYQVSIDQNRAEWLEAVEKDQLTWIQVGDMKGSVRALQTYNVRTIPYNYLLNGDGEIVGQDLRGPALDQSLAKLLIKK